MLGRNRESAPEAKDLQRKYCSFSKAEVTSAEIRHRKDKQNKISIQRKLQVAIKNCEKRVESSKIHYS